MVSIMALRSLLGLIFALPPCVLGSLQMSANATFPVCPGENVLFTCISSQSYFTRWIITFASRSVVSQVVENHQLVGSHYSRNQGSINLIFTVRSINPLESTLLMTSSIYYRLLNDAEVECSDLDNVQQIHYIIHEGAPPRVSDIRISDTSHGSNHSNVTVTWNIPTARVDSYVLSVTMGLISELANITAVIISNVNYNRNVTFDISAVCCGLQGETTDFIFTIEPIAPMNASFQEVCPTPSFQPNIIIEYYDGLLVRYHCNVSFVPQDVITAICHSRKWFPDIRKHECMLSSNKSMGARVPIPEVSQNGTAWNNTYHSKKWIYVSSGASVGSLLIFTAIALLLFYTIMSRRKRESHQANQYTTKESSPTYDTIISDAEQYTTKESSPIYETIISDADTMDLKVEFVKTTSNEAYRKI